MLSPSSFTMYDYHELEKREMAHSRKLLFGGILLSLFIIAITLLFRVEQLHDSLDSLDTYYSTTVEMYGLKITYDENGEISGYQNCSIEDDSIYCLLEDPYTPKEITSRKQLIMFEDYYIARIATPWNVLFHLPGMERGYTKYIGPADRELCSVCTCLGDPIDYISCRNISGARLTLPSVYAVTRLRVTNALVDFDWKMLETFWHPFTKLEILTVDGSTFPLTEDMMLYMKDLTILRLRYLQMRCIPRHFFDPLDHLTVVDLSNNLLITLDYTGLQRSKFVNLANNDLENIYNYKGDNVIIFRVEGNPVYNESFVNVDNLYKYYTTVLPANIDNVHLYNTTTSIIPVLEAYREEPFSTEPSVSLLMTPDQKVHYYFQLFVIFMIIVTCMIIFFCWMTYVYYKKHVKNVKVQEITDLGTRPLYTTSI